MSALSTPVEAASHFTSHLEPLDRFAATLRMELAQERHQPRMSALATPVEAASHFTSHLEPLAHIGASL
jgi:hypothetical protein